MKTCSEHLKKTLTGALVCLLLNQFVVRSASAQDPPPAGFNLVVVEGEGEVNSSRQKAPHDAVIRTEDDNHKPIAGAAVVFTLPTEGATGVFDNGSQTLITLTDSNGLAKARGIRLNNVSGKLVIHVSASFRGLSAHTVINQTNEGVPGAKASSGGGGHGGRVALILLLVGAAAGGGAYYATHRTTSSSPSTPPPPTVPVIGITPGTGTIIGPH